MKHKAIILLGALLIGGCQTTQSVEPKVEVKSELSSHVGKKERPRAFQTDKPVACVESKLALAKLEEMAGEIPHALWYDTTKNYRVLMMINKEAKTVTIMEYIPTPKEFSGSGDIQFVCFLSMGTGLYIDNKVEATKVSFGMEN
jgi:PBP1b-binding outer membrane lipoprotein LpoB